MKEDVQWFLVRLGAELPVRIHSRDTAENGNPELAHAFLAYITDSDALDGNHGDRPCPDGCRKEHRYATVHRTEQDFCNHPTLPPGAKGHCPTCTDTGLRVRVRKVYRNPMTRALRQLAAKPVRAGRPPLDVVLWALAANDGNVGMAIASLCSEWAFMWAPHKARRWMCHALYEVRAAYKEDVPAQELRDRISENQAIAEAAA